MKFPRSLIGYHPRQVDIELNSLAQRFSDEKRLLVEEHNQSIELHNQLLSRHNGLLSSLESARASALLLSRYEQEHREKVLQSIESAAKLKVQAINAERDAMVKELEVLIAELDNHAESLKGELNEVATEIGKMASSINSYHYLDEQLQATDLAVESYRALALRKVPATVFTPEIAARLMPIAMIENTLYRTDNHELPLLTGAKPFITQIGSSVHQGAQALPKNLGLHSEMAQTVAESQKQVVIIAEQDRETASLLSSIVNREGLEVVVVVDGTELNHLVASMEQPALLILNSLLPYMDVAYFITGIRQAGKWHRVPIIVLTPSHNKQDVINAIEAGANDSMEIPFNPHELSARIKGLTRIAEGESNF